MVDRHTKSSPRRVSPHWLHGARALFVALIVPPRPASESLSGEAVRCEAGRLVTQPGRGSTAYVITLTPAHEGARAQQAMSSVCVVPCRTATAEASKDC